MLVEEYFQVVSLSAARRGRQELLISNSIEVTIDIYAKFILNEMI